MFKILLLCLLTPNCFSLPVSDFKEKRDLRSKLRYLPPARGQSNSQGIDSIPKVSRALSLPDKEFEHYENRNLLQHELHQNTVSDGLQAVPKPFDILQGSVEENSRISEHDQPGHLDSLSIVQAPIVFSQRVTGISGGKPVVFPDHGNIKHVQSFEAPSIVSSFSEKEFRQTEQHDFSIPKSEPKQPSGLYDLPISEIELKQSSGDFRASDSKSTTGSAKPFDFSIHGAEQEQPSGVFEFSSSKSEGGHSSGSFSSSATKSKFRPSNSYEFSDSISESGLYELPISEGEREHFSASRSETEHSSASKNDLESFKFFDFSDHTAKKEQPPHSFEFSASRSEAEHSSGNFESSVTSTKFRPSKARPEQPSNLFEFSDSRKESEQPIEGFQFSVSKSELDSSELPDFSLSIPKPKPKPKPKPEHPSGFKESLTSIFKPNKPSGLYELPQSPSEVIPQIFKPQLPLESVSEPKFAQAENSEPLAASGNEIDQTLEEGAPSQQPQPLKGMPYNFAFDVQDARSGNYYSQRAVSDGEVTEGEYSILLPDGRIQVVKYKDDGTSGFVAKVSYKTP